MRPIKVAIIVAGLIGGLAVARLVIRRGSPGLMDLMAENVMPQMMDACFGQMSQEQRAMMLGHCRGMLDRMDLKYGVTGSPEHFVEADTMPIGVA